MTVIADEAAVSAAPVPEATSAVTVCETDASTTTGVTNFGLAA
jgi:hypothetical protein